MTRRRGPGLRTRATLFVLTVLMAVIAVDTVMSIARFRDLAAEQQRTGAANLADGLARSAGLAVAVRDAVESNPSAFATAVADNPRVVQEAIRRDATLLEGIVANNRTRVDRILAGDPIV